MACYDDTIVDRFLEPCNQHDVDGALALPDVNYQPVRNSFARTMSSWDSWSPRRSVTAAKLGSTPATFSRFRAG